MVGGLGNTMFQYALFRRFLQDGKETYYDSLQDKEHNGFELSKVFNIFEKPIESLDEIKDLKVVRETTYPRFNQDILNNDNGYIEGNWQNIKYFPDSNILRNDFKFKQDLSEKNKEILKDIKESNSISIHVRRTDYVKLAWYLFQANWMNYYGVAVNYVVKNTKERPIKFFVFSDDIEWCKKNFMISATFLETPKTKAWQDMYLMSQCKHNITTNSTFSWWAAWLNENENKIVTTPKKWFLDKTDSNYITCDEWIKI